MKKMLRQFLKKILFFHICFIEFADDVGNAWQDLGTFGIFSTEAEFKEFEPRLKYGWFHFKLYSMFQDLSRTLN